MSSAVMKWLQLWSCKGVAKGFGIEQQCVVIQMVARFSSYACWGVWRKVPWSLQSHRFVYLNLGRNIMRNSRNQLINHPCSSLVPVSHHCSGGASVQMGGWWMRSPKKIKGAGHTAVAPCRLSRVTEVSGIVQSLGPNFQRCCCPSTFQAKCRFRVPVLKGWERQWGRRSSVAERRIRKRKRKWNDTNKFIPITIRAVTTDFQWPISIWPSLRRSLSIVFGG